MLQVYAPLFDMSSLVNPLPVHISNVNLKGFIIIGQFDINNPPGRVRVHAKNQLSAIIKRQGRGNWNVQGNCLLESLSEDSEIIGHNTCSARLTNGLFDYNSIVIDLFPTRRSSDYRKSVV